MAINPPQPPPRNPEPEPPASVPRLLGLRPRAVPNPLPDRASAPEWAQQPNEPLPPPEERPENPGWLSEADLTQAILEYWQEHQRSLFREALKGNYLGRLARNQARATLAYARNRATYQSPAEAWDEAMRQVARQPP